MEWIEDLVDGVEDGEGAWEGSDEIEKSGIDADFIDCPKHESRRREESPIVSSLKVGVDE